MQNQRCFSFGALMKCAFSLRSGVHVSIEPMARTLKNISMADHAFWSVTVCDKRGFAAVEKFNVNSAFAKGNDQGEYAIRIGGDHSQCNYLGLCPGQNVALRVYSPVIIFFDGSLAQSQLDLVK